MTGSNQLRTGGQFHSTHWSVVVSAASGCNDALAKLCSDYWRPLYWQVRRMGYAPNEAEDLMQSFLTRLIDKRLVAQAEPKRGRFRTFLLTALRRFVINEWKRARTQRAGGNSQIQSLDFASAEAQMAKEPWHDITPDALYERRWAIQVLENAVARLQAAQQDAGKGSLFDQLVPYLTEAGELPGYEPLAVEFATTVGALKMTVNRWRQELGRLIRAEIRQTVSDDGEVDDEVQRMIAAFAR